MVIMPIYDSHLIFCHWHTVLDTAYGTLPNKYVLTTKYASSVCATMQGSNLYWAPLASGKLLQ